MKVGLVVFWIILVTHLQKGGMTPCVTRCATWVLLPLMVRLEMAQAASFWV